MSRTSSDESVSLQAENPIVAAKKVNRIYRDRYIFISTLLVQFAKITRICLIGGGKKLNLVMLPHFLKALEPKVRQKAIGEAFLTLMMEFCPSGAGLISMIPAGMSMWAIPAVSNEKCAISMRASSQREALMKERRRVGPPSIITEETDREASASMMHRGEASEGMIICSTSGGRSVRAVAER